MTSSSSENLLNYDPWTMFRSNFTDSFLSEAFAQNTDDVLTKAFHNSLYHSDSVEQMVSADTPAMMSPFVNFVNPATVSSLSGSDNSGPVLNRRRNNVPANGIGGKIPKRKSRASDRHKTTFINADPENFRQLVQQVTGVKFGSSNSAKESAIGTIMKPGPQRPGNDYRLNSCLPTLDTSSFPLDRYQQEQANVSQRTSLAVNEEGHVSYSTAAVMVGDVGSGGSGIGFDSLSRFPTLESWTVI